MKTLDTISRLLHQTPQKAGAWTGEAVSHRQRVRRKDLSPESCPRATLLTVVHVVFPWGRPSFSPQTHWHPCIAAWAVLEPREHKGKQAGSPSALSSPQALRVYSWFLALSPPFALRIQAFPERWEMILFLSCPYSPPWKVWASAWCSGFSALDPTWYLSSWLPRCLQAVSLTSWFRPPGENSAQVRLPSLDQLWLWDLRLIALSEARRWEFLRAVAFILAFVICSNHCTHSGAIHYAH